MPSLNALVATPGSQEPPAVQGTSGTGGQASLQSLLQPGQGQGGGQQMQPPSHAETVAVLQHISAFDQRWRQILQDPEIGSKSVRPMVLDMMADMMGDGYASLPQVMGLLKTMPTDPLEQKQWIEEHYQNDLKAMQAIIEHHAQGAGPPTDPQAEMAQMQQSSDERGKLVDGVIGRYKQHQQKPATHKKMGIPLRG